MHKKFDLSLKILGAVVQSAPNHPLKAERIAEMLGLSTSYVELLLGSLRRAGLLISVRGAGGGFLPSSQLAHASALDVYRLFHQDEADMRAERRSSSASSVHDSVELVCQQMHDIGEVFLRNFPLTTVLRSAPYIPTPSSTGFKLQPIAPSPRPNAPNSIFDLARFGHVEQAISASKRVVAA